MTARAWRDVSLAEIEAVNARRGRTAQVSAATVTSDPPRSRSKFHNEAIWIGDQRFASRHEADEWIKLCEAERRGELVELRRQVSFDLCCPSRDGSAPVIAQYIADFVWRDPHGVLIVADAKGVRTPLFALKAKWLLLQYGLPIRLL